jgi:hypothetical protein
MVAAVMIRPEIPPLSQQWNQPTVHPRLQLMIRKKHAWLRLANPNTMSVLVMKSVIGFISWQKRWGWKPADLKL